MEALDPFRSEHKHDMILSSWMKFSDGRTTFRYFADTFDTLEVTVARVLASEDNNFWHTVFLEGREVGLKIDIDFPTDADEEGKNTMVPTFLNAIIGAVDYVLGEDFDIINSVVATDQDNYLVCCDLLHKEKLSMHIHCDYITFTDVRHLAEFMRHVCEHLHTHEPELADSIDQSIYAFNKSMKMPLQRKADNREPQFIFTAAGMGEACDMKNAIIIGLAHKPLFPDNRVQIEYEDIAAVELDSEMGSRIKRSLTELHDYTTEDNGYFYVVQRNGHGNTWYVQFKDKDRVRACIVDPETTHVGTTDGKKGKSTIIHVINDNKFRVDCLACGQNTTMNLLQEEEEENIERLEQEEKDALSDDLYDNLRDQRGEHYDYDQSYEIGDDLPTDTIRDAMRAHRSEIQRVTNIFNSYWGRMLRNREKKNGRKRRKIDDAKGPSVAELRLKFQDALDVFTNSITGFMNNWLCEVRLGGKYVIACYEPHAKAWMIRNANSWEKECDSDFTYAFPFMNARGSFVTAIRSYNFMWRRNQERRVATSINTYFRREQIEAGVLNVFTGLELSRARVFNEVGEEPVELLRAAVTPYIRYLQYVVCQGDPSRYNYLQKWIYEVIVEKRKPETAIVLIGEQGTGKTTLCHFLRKIVGDRSAIFVNKSSEATGKHNSHFEGKMIVFSEEAVHSTDKKGVNVLKDHITNDVLLINRKMVPQYTVRNNMAFVFTGNSVHTVCNEHKDRRFVFYHVTHSMNKAQAEEYFGKLNRVDPVVVAWYYYYDYRNNNEINLRVDIPKANNTLHFETALATAPYYVQFIYELLNNNFDAVRSADRVGWLEQYNRWVSERRLRGNTFVASYFLEKELALYTVWDNEAGTMMQACTQEAQIAKFRAVLTDTAYNPLS
jgi:energy-coupling factor transporter ATP-binding protein EcfA2